MQHPGLGRYSFLMADPVEWFQPHGDRVSETFAWLDSRLGQFPVERLPDLPPFQGGIAGLFDYEFNAAIETLPASTENRSPIALGIYDVVIAWDHTRNQVWLISTGYSSDDSGHPRVTQQRADRFRKLLESGPETDPVPFVETATPVHGTPCPEHPSLVSNFDESTYLQTIEKALEYIRAGDIFQVNIAQQLMHPATVPAFELYQRLCQCNPSTFAAFFDVGQRQVISASPERLISIDGGRVETRPIKGTRRRTRHPEVDIHVAQQLLTSDKDRAENVMIVDLMRNDLSRICTDESVIVSQFVELESYASVLHLVSAVQGTLRDGITPSDVIRAIFPGGSITGAPKVRAMEIIAELEPTARGPYCGSLGYFGFNGNIDLNILIRTITAEDGLWKIPVGGGIVADSEPAREYEETWTKAYGMLKAVLDFSPELSGGDR